MTLSLRRSPLAASSWLTLRRAGSGDIEKHSSGSADAN